MTVSFPIVWAVASALTLQCHSFQESDTSAISIDERAAAGPGVPALEADPVSSSSPPSSSATLSSSPSIGSPSFPSELSTSLNASMASSPSSLPSNQSLPVLLVGSPGKDVIDPTDTYEVMEAPLRPTPIPKAPTTAETATSPKDPTTAEAAPVATPVQTPAPFLKAQKPDTDYSPVAQKSDTTKDKADKPLSYTSAYGESTTCLLQQAVAKGEYVLRVQRDCSMRVDDALRLDADLISEERVQVADAHTPGEVVLKRPLETPHERGSKLSRPNRGGQDLFEGSKFVYAVPSLILMILISSMISLIIACMVN